MDENLYKIAPASQVEDLEGSVVSGRPRWMYERFLNVPAEEFRNKKILNFGSGGSHLSADLKGLGIQSFVVDVDMHFDPYEKYQESFGVLKTIAAASAKGLADALQNIDPHVSAGLEDVKRIFAGTKGRNFVQANGRNLPFSDKAFDQVVALQSTYQIPLDAKETVYRELFRVGDTVRLGPIFLNDFEILQKLSEEMGFEIVECQPWRPVTLSVLGSNTYENRSVIPPTGQESTIIQTSVRARSATHKGASRIILKRRTETV